MTLKCYNPNKHSAPATGSPLRMALVTMAIRASQMLFASLMVAVFIINCSIKLLLFLIEPLSVDDLRNRRSKGYIINGKKKFFK